MFKKILWIISFLFLLASCGLQNKKQAGASETRFAHLCGDSDALNVEKRDEVPVIDLNTIPSGAYKVISVDMWVQWQYSGKNYSYRYAVEQRRNNSIIETEICHSLYSDNDSILVEFPMVATYNFTLDNGVEKREFAMQKNSLWLRKNAMNYKADGTGSLTQGNFSAGLTTEFTNWIVYKLSDKRFEIRAEKNIASGGRPFHGVMVQVIETL